jgi:tetratricopeptide (TPR) repeat protein
MKLIRAYNDVGEDLDSKESEPYYEKAVQFAEVLLEKFPEKSGTYFYLSVSYGNMALFAGGKKKVKLSRKVKENAEKAIELDPQHAESYVVLGIYYREVANLNRLLKAFAKVFFGGLPGGTNEDAERSFLKALELKPKYINAHFQLAKTYEKMKEKDKAITTYEKVLELPVRDHQDNALKTKAEKRLNKLRK